MEVEQLCYTVLQSDGHSFCVYVVLDSFNMSYRDEDSILDQKYKKQISWDHSYEDFKQNNWRKCIFKEIQQIKLGFNATVVVLVCILAECYEELKSP